MMGLTRVGFILSMGLGLAACSKATPDFDLLDQDAIPQPKFSGLTTKDLTATSGSVTFTINGECDPKIRSLKAKVTGLASSYVSVGDLTVSTPTVNCSSNGTFSFVLKGLTALGFSPLQEGHTYEVQLAGYTSAGTSKPSFIRIKYASNSGNPALWLAAGGVHGNRPGSGGNAGNAMTISGGTFKADISVGFTAKQAAGYPGSPSIMEVRTGAASR